MTTQGPKQLFGLSLTRVLGLLLVPLMIAGLFLWGLWDPTSRMHHVSAAVVNNDEPVEVDGQLTPLGRVLAAELIGTTESENFTWSLTNDEGAEAGLASGEFVSVITIPENFSHAATSIAGDPADAEQATIEVETSEHAKLLDTALSTAVTETATRVLNEQLGEAFVGNIYVAFNELGEGLDEAGEGAGELADGSRTLADGTEELASGAGELADGTGELAAGTAALADGADELAAGAGGLAGGMSEFASGTAQLEAGTNELAGGAKELAEGLTAYANGVQEIADGTTEAAQGQQQLAAGVDEYVTTINGALKPISGFAQQAADFAQELKTQIETGEIPIPEEQRPQILEALQQVIDSPALLDQAIQGGNDLVAGSYEQASGLDELAGGMHGLASGAYGIAGGAGELAGGAGELAAQIPQLNAGAQELASGAQELAGGAGQAAAGTRELASGTSDLAAGAGELASGTDELAEGTGELADGADDLADGLAEAAAEIPRTTQSERDKLASLAVEPVSSGDDTTSLFSGSGAPLFLGLALWAGALAVFTLVTPVWPRARDAALSEATITLRSASPALLVGALQGLFAGMLVAIVLGLAAQATFAMLAIAVLAGVSFALVNQGLVALFGGPGRFVSLLVLVVAFVAGIVSTTPGVLGTIASFTPVGTAMQAINSVTVHGTPGLGATVLLGVWAAAGFIVLGAAVHKVRKPR